MEISHKKSKNKLFYLILFLFQFEFLGDGDLSVYRLLIFPLLIVGILLQQTPILKKDFFALSFYVAYISIALLFELSYKSYSSLFPSIAALLTLFYSCFYLKNNYNITKGALLAMSTYSISHLYVFLINLGSFNLSNRFSGIHWNPNYMCAYVLIALYAKFFLLDRFIQSKVVKILFCVLIALDITMILYSLSKGGIIALLLTFIYYLWFKNKKVAISLTILIAMFINIAIIRSYSLEWSQDLSLTDY